MFSEKNFEKLWFLYKTEGEPKGVSINSFCISNNIPYTAFYDWFKKTLKKVVPVEVDGSIMVTIRIRTREGKSKKNPLNWKFTFIIGYITDDKIVLEENQFIAHYIQNLYET